jgi:hypothetical protein
MAEFGENDTQKPFLGVDLHAGVWHCDMWMKFVSGLVILIRDL